MWDAKIFFKRFRTIFILFLLGYGLGWSFHHFLVKNFKFPQLADEIIYYILTLFTAIGFATSVQVRCISALIIPSIFSRKGRTFTKALIFTWLIAGPVQNMIQNGHELVRVLSCSSAVQFNLTQIGFDFMFQPFLQAFFSIALHSIDEQDTSEESIKSIIKQISKEIEGAKDSRQRQFGTLTSNEYKQKYFTKMENKCNKVFEKATEKCKTAFATTFDDCLEKVPARANDILCPPLKVEHICDLTHNANFRDICDPKYFIDENIGENYLKLLKFKKNLKFTYKSYQLYYKFGDRYKEIINADKSEFKEDNKQKANIFFSSLIRNTMAVTDELKEKKNYILSVLHIFSSCLALMIVLSVTLSHSYHDSYLTKLDFANIYITEYFKEIDDRRKNVGKPSLLPLKKAERNAFFYKNACSWIKTDLVNNILVVILLFAEALANSVLIIMDYLFYKALITVQHHGQFNSSEAGVHEISFEIEGNSYTARIMNHIIKSLNISKEVKISRDSSECLPVPTYSSLEYIIKIYLSYVIVFALTFTNVYAAAINRKICAFFYPKREKDRILFLYNMSLKRRHRQIKHTKEIMMSLAREVHLKKKYSMLVSLRSNHPRLFGWLKIFDRAKRCLLCNESNLTFFGKKKLNFYYCPTCEFMYCMECWNDMSGICYVCLDLHFNRTQQ